MQFEHANASARDTVATEARLYSKQPALPGPGRPSTLHASAYTESVQVQV
jgi:hypothetical protein